MEPIRLIANPSLKKPLEKHVLPGIIASGHKGRVLVSIDTHSVSATGALVFGGSQGSYKSAPINKVSGNLIYSSGNLV
jgi:hypothetical protein